MTSCPRWNSPLAADLDHVLSHTEGLWEELRGQRLFITGGTGFFGCWLLESFLWANDRLGLEASVLVLTRSPDAFKRKASHLASHPSVQFHVGDIRSFEFPAGRFTHVIHAAASTRYGRYGKNAIMTFDSILEGTRRTLEFARNCGARKFLLTSSGAVYGKQPPDMSHIPESYQGASDPLDFRSPYGEGKRAAEVLCALYAKQYGLETKIARCFAFVGPYLPMDDRFAVGSFIRDGLQGGPILLKGDGTPSRTYLYASDLAIWLWTILFRGASCRPYNVGSEVEITISQLANLVAESFQPKERVRIADMPSSSQVPERYTPCTRRAAVELGLGETVGLPEAIRKSIAWLVQRRHLPCGRGIEG
jgi:nucleoside-diphosphate-sugar epimerase